MSCKGEGASLTCLPCLPFLRGGPCPGRPSSTWIPLAFWFSSLPRSENHLGNFEKKPKPSLIPKGSTQWSRWHLPMVVAKAPQSFQVILIMDNQVGSHCPASNTQLRPLVSTLHPIPAPV